MLGFCDGNAPFPNLVYALLPPMAAVVHSFCLAVAVWLAPWPAAAARSLGPTRNASLTMPWPGMGDGCFSYVVLSALARYALRSFVSLQFPLSPMRVLSIGIEHALDVAV